jgi:hypothetical protein
MTDFDVRLTLKPPKAESNVIRIATWNKWDLRVMENRKRRSASKSGSRSTIGRKFTALCSHWLQHDDYGRPNLAEAWNMVSGQCHVYAGHGVGPPPVETHCATL